MRIARSWGGCWRKRGENPPAWFYSVLPFAFPRGLSLYIYTVYIRHRSGPVLLYCSTRALPFIARFKSCLEQISSFRRRLIGKTMQRCRPRSGDAGCRSFPGTLRNKQFRCPMSHDCTRKRGASSACVLTYIPRCRQQAPCGMGRTYVE